MLCSAGFFTQFQWKINEEVNQKYQPGWSVVMFWGYKLSFPPFPWGKKVETLAKLFLVFNYSVIVMESLLVFTGFRLLLSEVRVIPLLYYCVKAVKSLHFVILLDNWHNYTNRAWFRYYQITSSWEKSLNWLLPKETALLSYPCHPHVASSVPNLVFTELQSELFKSWSSRNTFPSEHVTCCGGVGWEGT